LPFEQPLPDESELLSLLSPSNDLHPVKTNPIASTAQAIILKKSLYFITNLLILRFPPLITHPQG
jgi:hypothetical protein